MEITKESKFYSRNYLCSMAWRIQIILFVKVKTDILQYVSKEIVLPFCFGFWSLPCIDNKGQAK